MYLLVLQKYRAHGLEFMTLACQLLKDIRLTFYPDFVGGFHQQLSGFFEEAPFELGTGCGIVLRIHPQMSGFFQEAAFEQETVEKSVLAFLSFLLLC